MRFDKLDSKDSFEADDLVLVSSNGGTDPALADASAIAPEPSFDPNVARSIFLDKCYPIGSYIETNGEDPSSELGGSWDRVIGTFLFSRIDVEHAVSDRSQISSGSKTVTLTERTMPAHLHSMTGSHYHHYQYGTFPHTHASANHAHTASATSNHTHTVASHSHTDSHTHTISAGSRPGVGLTLRSECLNRAILPSGGALSATLGLNASSGVTGMYSGGSGTTSYKSGNTNSVTSSSITSYTDTSTSTSTKTTTPSNVSSGYTEYSGALTANITGNSGSYGSGGAHENMPPYYATNIWKRVA